MLLLSGLLLGCDSVNSATVPEDISLSDQSENVEESVSWLIENNQNDDGGYGVNFETGEPASAPASTLDAILAIASGGFDPDAPYEGRSATPVSYLSDNADDLTGFAQGSGGNAGKVILALTAAKQDTQNFAMNNWVMILMDQYSATGQFNTPDAFNQSLAIMALTAVNEPVPEAAVKWLKDQQASDGSWDDGYGTLQNADATAMSIMALAAAGVPSDDPELANGLEFLAESQLPTGGWEYGPGFGENANSTALVIQALAATGNNYYEDDGPWAQDGNSPLSALLNWQNRSGAFQADFGQGPFDDFFSTVQAIPAVNGKPLPLPAWDSE
jgi:hypothetical protein